jgi:serine protease AprX
VGFVAHVGARIARHLSTTPAYRAKQHVLMPTTRANRTPDSRIKPIAERLGADARFTGRGITIAFLDAGFYAHNDIVKPRSRVKVFHDVLSHESAPHQLPPADVSSWHGMMTAVVACGNGDLSHGKYKGLAHESELVLVKVGSVSRIRHDDITLGIDWVIANRERLGIRVLNISCGGDYEASYLWDGLSRAAEAAVRAGIVVVCAAGNAGHDPQHPVVPPASTPAVITVGGFDDEQGALDRCVPYHSSYGPTLDGVQKPEIIAPAIRIAAPILPGTSTAKQAELLAELTVADDHELRDLISASPGVDRELDAAKHLQPYQMRQIIASKRAGEKVISKHYKEVDGTSFAAPIVASVVAQMLEARPDLTPQAVKRILIDSAVRMPHVPIDRQGWGVCQPATAVARALEYPQHEGIRPW